LARAQDQGTLLPEGIYFDPDYSKDYQSSSTMTLDYPRYQVGIKYDRNNGGGGEEYFYYTV
jgi:hypothetical protein